MTYREFSPDEIRQMESRHFSEVRWEDRSIGLAYFEPSTPTYAEVYRTPVGMVYYVIRHFPMVVG